MSSTTCVLLLLFTLCPEWIRAANNFNGSAQQSLPVKVVEVLFIHSYCAQEHFDSQDVYKEVKSKFFQLNSSLATSSTADAGWVINLSEGDVKASALDALLQSLLLTSSDFLALLYPGCSGDTQYLAEISHSSLFNITLLTYAFSDLDTTKLSYPNHFRMVPTEKHLASAIGAVMNTFMWKRMAIFAQDLPVFSAISGRVSTLLNVTIADVYVADSMVNDNNAISFPEDIRIFVLNMYPARASAILCQAYHQDMTFPDYVWITYGWYSSYWWMDSYPNAMVNCTPAELESVLVGSIALSHYYHPNDLNQSSPSVDTSAMYKHTASDAISTIFDALSISVSVGNKSNVVLDEVIKTVKFSGRSGPVSFERQTNMRAIEQVTVFQYRKVGGSLKMFKIGYVPVNTPDDNLYFYLDTGIDTEDIWQGDVPADGTPVTVLKYPLLPLMVTCYAFATAGILFAVVCLVFNIAFRNRRLIRLTSPTINFVIILGAIVFYSSVYTFFYVPATPSSTIVVICNFRLWLTSIGFSLCYVPINVKMWRVYHISRKPSLKKAVIKDWHLLLIILVFVVVDLVLLGLVTLIESSRYTVAVIPDKENPGTFINEQGFTASYEVTRCYSATEPYWIAVVFGYKLLLQAIGVFLAFSIRKVKIKGLNDSREVSIILYVNSLILFVTILETLILGDYINVDGGVYGLGISTATTILLGFIFIPKMYGLYKDPKGRNIFVVPSPSHYNSGTAKSQIGSNLGNTNCVDHSTKDVTVIALYKKIEALESALVEQNSSAANRTKVSESSSSDLAQTAEVSTSE